MQTVEYWRESKTWKDWLGKSGVVVASTVVNVSAPEFESSLPYSVVLVEFGRERREFLGAGNEVFSIGQKVQCVLRKLGQTDEKSIIPYGIKVTSA